MISLQQLARALGGEVSGRQVLAPGPGHSPDDRSLSVKLDLTDPADFICNSFANDDWKACRDHVREKLGLAAFNAKFENGSTKSKIVANYDYLDEAGEVLFRVVRKHPKSFSQCRPNGRGLDVEARRCAPGALSPPRATLRLLLSTLGQNPFVALELDEAVPHHYHGKLHWKMG